MRIAGLLKGENIELGIKVSDKGEAVNRLASLTGVGGRLRDIAGYKEGVLARGALGSTVIDKGIAIPHAKVEAAKEPGLTAMVVPEGIDYDAFNGSLADPLFMIAASAKGADIHLETLPRPSTLFMNPRLREGFVGTADKDEFLHIIDEAETERFGAPEGEAAKGAKADAKAGASSGYRTLTVTVCPIGIAHIYMTAENLENTGKKLGVILEVETDGSDGTQNTLTKEEIAAADAIIIAANKNVEMTRFNGEPIIVVSVTDGIHKAEESIKRIMDGTVLVYHHTGAAGGESVSEGSNSIGRIIYKHLVNGVSRMLPFAIGGGVLITPAFLSGDHSINPVNFGKDTPLVVYLRAVGGQAFGMMLPILTGLIAMSIADRPGLVVDLVVGLITRTGSTLTNLAGGDVDAGFLGILFADFVGGYIMVSLRKLFSKLPKSLEGTKPVLLYPVISILLTAMVTTFINPYMGMANDGFTHFLNGMGGTGRTVLGMVLGGMMSIDVGGLFNEVAYVFGIAQLTEGSFEVMAAVMADDMMPSITIALCTILFKGKFMEGERQFGIVDHIMGLSFIIGGVTPFAAQDPLRVIPSYITGSATAGGLSMAFSCTLRASHGGAFVLPTIGNRLTYLAAVAAGATTGCVILGMFKRNAAQ